MGNKRCETKHIISNLPEINDETVIIDICCGSAAIAYNIWKLYPNNKYILNDIDSNLYQLLSCIKSGDILSLIEECNSDIKNMTVDEIKQMKKIKIKSLKEYIIVNKCITGTYAKPQPIKITKKKLDFFTFIQSDNVEIHNSDWLKLYDLHNNDKSLFLFDPPYAMSYNLCYSNEMKNTLVNPYEYFYNNDINKQPSKIMFILENVWFIEMLFKNNIKYRYEKMYSLTQRKSEHIIINNYS